MEPATSDPSVQSEPDDQPCEGSHKPSQGLVPLAIVVLGLALAAGLAYRQCDARLARFFLKAEIPPKATWLLAIGELGRPLAPIFLLLLWAWAEKRPRLLLAGLLAMLLTLCAVLPIKSAVGRIRPDENSAEVQKEPFYRRSYSFPSGDATLAFAVAVVAASAIPASARWIPFLLAAMAGMTRLMLLRHFASDVIAGAALGILCGYAALKISRSTLARRALSRAPPRSWRPALGIATLLFLIVDAVTKGPVTRNFLPIFWPAVAFVLIVAKGPAWLDWMYPRKRLWIQIARLSWELAGIFLPAWSFLLAACCMYLIAEKWTWFLPAAAMPLIGVCWAAPWRLAHGRRVPGLHISRMLAASVLSFGLSLEALKAAAQVLGR